NANAPALDPEALSRIRNVDVATFGHFLEDGFIDPEIRQLTGSAKIIGRAVTVKIAPGDSTLAHYAVSLLEEGDVLVVDTSGDRNHAAMGGFVISALVAAKASAAVIDGVCTDLDALRKSGVAVYARGTSVLTNKLLGAD